MAPEKDLYALLGVSKSASADELRRAYRKLARTHHPDMNPDNKVAEERFKEISSAYDTLSNPEKRTLYDEFGAQGIREGFDAEKAREYQRWTTGRQGGGGGGGGGAGNPFVGGQPFGGQGGGFDLGDLFGDFFGGHGGPRPRAGQGRDLLARVEIDFAQSLRGCEITLPMTGADPVTVRIPPGADNGSKLRVGGRGEPGTGGGAPGDLVIETHVKPHPFFSRNGLDVILRLPVTLDEAYNGATLEIPTPSGSVNLRIPPRSQQGARLRLRGKGVQRGKKSGDLYVDVDVRLPDNDDASVAEAMRSVSHGYSKPVRQDVRL